MIILFFAFMLNDVKNVQSLVNQAVESNELDSQSDLAINYSNYEYSLVVGASHGKCYALFYKKSNCWVARALENATDCIKTIRTNFGDIESLKRLDIIENAVFDNDLNDGYFLIEVKAFKNPFDSQLENLPMFYNI